MHGRVRTAAPEHTSSKPVRTRMSGFRALKGNEKIVKMKKMIETAMKEYRPDAMAKSIEET